MPKPLPLLITLFTRANCSLCTTAKEVLFRVYSRRPFTYKEVDVLKPEYSRWKVYEFDTPVIHIDALPKPDHIGETTTAAKKLMHRLEEKQVEDAMNEVEKAGPTIN